MSAFRAIVLLLFSLAAIATASASEPPRPSCGGMFDLCAYVDAAGSEVIPGPFENARPFQSGLAAVRIDGLWGFIDLSGNIVIAPRFLAVGDFQDTRAEAASDEGVGVIERDGAFVIPPRFGRAIPFTEDIALVSELGDRRPERMVQYIGRTDLLYSFRLFHRRDGWLTDTPLKFTWFRRPQDGGADLIWAKGRRSEDLYGLMDARGNWVVQPQFGHVQALFDGRAVVRGPKHQDRWGAVDKHGRIAIPLNYHWLSYFENGYAILGGPGDYYSRKRGLIRSDGTVVAEPVFDEAKRPEKGGLPRVRRDGIWYSVERAGELVLAADYNEADGTLIASCPQGLRIERHGSGYLVTDADGRPTLPEPVDRVSFGIPNDRGWISAAALSSRDLDCRVPIIVSHVDSRDGAWRSTYVRPDGRPLFDPPRFFRTVHRFILGHAVVGTARRNEVGEWGIIDMEGRFTLPLGPEPVHALGGAPNSPSKPIFRLGDGDSARLVDAQGQRVPDVETAIDRARRQQVLSCGNGIRISGDGEGFGLAGPDGETLVPAIHRAISCFRSGVAWAPREDRRSWCPIGPDGAFRDAPACVGAFYPIQISHHYPERFVDDPYENSVLWVRARLRYGLGLREKPPCWVGDGVRSRTSCWVEPFRP